jgi:hypothetical protein
MPSPNPLIVPTKIGGLRIHVSSLYPYKSERLVNQQCNWLYAACARQYSGQWFLARPCQEQPLSLGTSTYRLEASLASCLPYARRPFCETLPNTSNSAVTNSMSCFQTVVLIARLLCIRCNRERPTTFSLRRRLQHHRSHLIFAEKAGNHLVKWGTYATATNPTRWSNSTLQPVWWSVGAFLRLPLEANVKGGYHGLRCYVGQTQHELGAFYYTNCIQDGWGM